MRTKKTGRKLLLEVQPKVVDRLCSQLRAGCSVRTACQASGISQTCFHDYIRRANPQQSDHTPEFAQFAERVARARGMGKARLVAIVSKAAGRDWRAALELLRSIAPAEYASRVSRDQFEALKKAEQPEVVYLPQPQTEITTSIHWRSLPLPLNEAQLRYIAGVQEQTREQGEQ